jgi:hypothetical protein
MSKQHSFRIKRPYQRVVLVAIVLSIITGLYVFAVDSTQIDRPDIQSSTVYRIGDALNAGPWQFKIKFAKTSNSLTLKDHTGKNQVLKPNTTDSRFLTYVLEATNVSGSDQVLDTDMIKLVLHDKITFINAVPQANIVANKKNELFLNTVQPDERIEARISFELQPNLKDFFVQFDHKLFGEQHTLVKVVQVN